VGARYAPLGMLATVALYFQQLPLAQLLFQLQHQQHQHQQQQPGAPAADAAHAAAAIGTAAPWHAALANAHSKVVTSPEPCSCEGCDLQTGGGADMHQLTPLRHLHHKAAGSHVQLDRDLEHQHQVHQQQGLGPPKPAAAGRVVGGDAESLPLLHTHSSKAPPQQVRGQEDAGSYVCSLLLKVGVSVVCAGVLS
jgi:hypothetical protein